MVNSKINTKIKTPLVKIELYEGMNIYVKLEGNNITGSMKDRPANFVLKKLESMDYLKKYDGIIESSSGNMGIALARACVAYNKKFFCVIDPKILSINKCIMNGLGANLIMVDKADEYGGYLCMRLKKVQELIEKYNLYWFNQYDNKWVIESYREIVDEVYKDLLQINYFFVSVSSCGSIAGISKRLKEISPKSKVIAVDTEGSIIFGQEAKKRHIPGVGSSIVPKNLSHTLIDDIVIVNEQDTIKKCLEFTKRFFFIGGSSGLVLAGIDKYSKLNKQEMLGKNVVTLFPDRGERYMNTIYDLEWRNRVDN